MHSGTYLNTPMGTTSGRDTSSLRGRPRRSAGPHIRQRSSGHARPRPNQLLQKKLYTLILIGIGLFRDLGCDQKRVEKTEKYSPPRRAPQTSLGESRTFSLSPSDTRVRRSQGPLNTSPSPFPRFAQERTKPSPTRAHHNPSRTLTQGATTSIYLFRG